jgi:hypothetical protein
VRPDTWAHRPSANVISTLAFWRPFSNRGLQVKTDFSNFALEVFVLFAVDMRSLHNPVR